MPLFGPSNNTNSQSHGSESPKRKGSIFSSRRSDSHSNSPDRSRNHSSSGGMFSRRRSSSSESSSGRSSPRNGGGFFGGGSKQDPTIRSARQKVSDAETAERDADRALVQARISVKEAREHVKALEKEAEEECVFFTMQFDTCSSLSYI